MCYDHGYYLNVGKVIERQIKQIIKTMRRLFTIITYLFVSGLYAATIPVKSIPEAVVIYLNRAEISRVGSIDLANGEHEIVFENLSSKIEANSIQIGGTGEVIILNTQFRLNFLTEESFPKELKWIKDSISHYEKDKNRLSNKQIALKAEEDMLKANKTVGGEDGITINQLKEISAFYKERMEVIANELYDIDLSRKIVDSKLGRLKKQLSSRTSALNQQQGEIVVNVVVKKSTKATFNLSYIVRDAGWYPTYNLRTDGTSTNVKLEQYAVIRQNTGENWDNVKLSLSTQNTDRKQKPNLYPWYLDIRQQYLTKSAPQQRAMSMAMNEMSLEEEVEMDIESSSGYVESVENSLSMRYDLTIPYSIENGIRDKRVALKEYSLPASYSHFAIPKLSESVFFTAELGEWQKLSLLPGEANIFLEGAFVGQTFLDPTSMEEKLVVSLGVDAGVLVERKSLIDFTDDQTIGSNRKRDYAYEVVLKNQKSSEVQVKLLDQVPISKNDEISVSIEELSGGKFDNTTGIVTWQKKLSPNDQQRVKLAYEVKYPKNKRINGL
ncbi:MAG: hypothetical protein ACJA0X_000273 [Cyclobacteriaceae bacterium]